MKTKIYISLLAIAGILTLSPYIFAQYTQQEQTNGNEEQTNGNMNASENQQNMANDSQITEAVKDKFSKEASLSNVTLNVATSQGVVSLTGDVGSKDQLTTAVVIAESVPGVRDVNTDSVTIDNAKASEQPGIADALITAKVKGMYIQKKLFGDKDVPIMSIDIATDNGVVSLSGTAENQDQIDNAISIAKTINGVSDVKSTVVIK